MKNIIVPILKLEHFYFWNYWREGRDTEMLSGNIFLVLLGVEAYTETCVEAYSSHLLKKSLMKNFNFCAVDGRDPAYISKYYHIEEPRFSCKMVRCTKKWSSALRIFLVNVTKSRVSADLVTFIKEILNGIFFLCNGNTYLKQDWDLILYQPYFDLCSLPDLIFFRVLQ